MVPSLHRNAGGIPFSAAPQSDVQLHPNYKIQRLIIKWYMPYVDIVRLPSSEFSDLSIGISEVLLSPLQLALQIITSGMWQGAHIRSVKVLQRLPVPAAGLLQLVPLSFSLCRPFVFLKPSFPLYNLDYSI